jgi:NitT/TauT family transport system substrate-binding protein
MRFGVGLHKLLVLKKCSARGFMFRSQLSLDRRHFVGLLATCMVVPAQADKNRVVIAVAARASLYHLPLTLAMQLGYFKSEGLNVELLDVPDDARAALAVTSGAADVASAGFESTITLQSRKQAVRAFVLQGRAPQVAFGLSLRVPNSQLAVKDLQGKNIGVDALGSPSHLVATLLLARAGLGQNDVNILSVGTATDAVAALRAGQIDALSHTDPAMTLLEQKGDVRIIGDTRSLRSSQQLFGGPMPASCLYASQEFVQRQPDTCQQLTNAVVHSLKWLQTAGPSDIIKTVPEAYLLGDRAMYLASFNKVREAFALDGLIPEDGLRPALNALASFDTNVQVKKIDLTKTYTNEFARRAKGLFKA